MTSRIGNIFVFFLLGASLSCIGVLIYDYRSLLGPSELSAQILQSRFFGALVGSLSAGYIDSRWSSRWNLVSMMVMAGGAMICLSLTGDQPAAFLVMHFCLGLSTAAVLLILSSQAIQNEKRGARGLLVLEQQTAFGVGAAMAPVVFFLGFSSHGSDRALTLLATLGVGLFLTTLLQWRIPHIAIEQAKGNGRQQRSSLLNYWPLYAAVFLYAGMENGLSNWLYTWLKQGSTSADSLLVISVFWIMVTVGRVTVLLLSKRPGFNKRAVGIIAAGGIATIAGALTVNLNQYWLLAAIGILIGPIYPAVLSLFSTTGKFHSFALSLASLASASGSIVLAANLGRLIEKAGAVAMPASISVLAFAIGFLLLFQVARRKIQSQPILQNPS